MQERPESITPVILAGGRGVRLWPLASAKRPKPFLKLFSRYNLLQKTLLRAEGCAAPVVVCAENHLENVQKSLQKTGTQPRCIIAEPEIRSTAASVALAAMRLENEPGYMMVMPSDHAMKSPQAFAAQWERARAGAGDDKIVIFGVRPRSHNTRYGYILTQEQQYDGVYKVQHFVEKPQKPRAVQLLASHHCLWNTGIFLCRPRVFLQELQRHAPEIYDSCRRTVEKGEDKPPVFVPEPASFARVPNIPVDVAVMEKSNRISAVELPTRWADIGTWGALPCTLFLRH